MSVSWWMRYLKQPIFQLPVILKEFIVIVSRGSVKIFAVRNKIISDSKFAGWNDREVEYEKEISFYINSLEFHNIFCTCVDNLTIFYKLIPQSGEFEEIYRLKVMDCYDTDNYQTVCKFDNRGEYFATGTTDKNLK